MEVWFDCKKVIGSVYKLLQQHSEHPSSKGDGQIEEELLCDILHFFIERQICLGGPDVPETLGGEYSGWYYAFFADWSEDHNNACYKINMCDYAITYGGVKLGEPYLFLDKLELLDEDEEDSETRWREDSDPCGKPEYAAKINKFETRLVGPDWL